MVAAPARRQTRLTRAGRVIRSILCLTPLAVPLVVVLAAGAPGPAMPKDSMVLDTGFSGPANSALGSFQAGPSYRVCRRFEVSNLPPQSQIIIDSFEIRFTSPPDVVPSGSVTWEIRAVAGDGQPGGVQAAGTVPIPSQPPDFPNTGAYTADVGGIWLDPGVTSFYLCVTTTNPDVHIATYSAPGRMLLLAIDGSSQQTLSDQDIGARVDITVLSGGATTPTAATTSTPASTSTPAPTSTPLPTATPPTAEPQCDLRIGQLGSGQGNAYFDSDWLAVIPTDGTSTQLRIWILPRGTNEWQLVTDPVVDPGMMVPVTLSDFVNNLFGSIRIQCFANQKRAGAGEPLSQAVIFARQPDGREFGQYFQAQDPDAAQQAGETSLLFTTHDPERYRVNIGLAAAADDTRVRLRALGDGGVELAAPDVIELDQDGASIQINDIDRAWSLGGTPNVLVEVTVLAGAAFPYGSVLDGHGAVPGTSDPTTVMPVTTGAPRAILLEVGRITGLSEFSGSASLYNHSNAATTVNASFYERGVPGVAATTSFQLAGRTVMSWDDVVGDLFDRTGVVGAVVFEAGGFRPVNLSAIGREFAIYSANGTVTGTAGQLLPGLSAADQLLPGETFHFIGLRDRQQPLGRERSHLGALNLGADDVTMTARSYDADGVFEGTVMRTVRAGEQLRVNNVLSAANPAQDGGLKRIEVTADGPLYVLAYRVNANGDPVTLGWFRR